MDQLEAESRKLAKDLENSYKLNELLLNYRLYFKEYLKLCKCKQTVDLLAIRSKTKDLEEEFQQLNSGKNVIEYNVENTDKHIDTKSGGITDILLDDQSSSFDGTDKVLPPNDVSTRNDSLEALQLQSQICPKKRVKPYICCECQVCFDDIIKLRAHQTIHRRTAAQHSGLYRRFVCQQNGCNKVFDRKSSLNVHISRLHKNKELTLEYKKSFVCDWIGCEHRTVNRQDMDLHIRRRHTLEKPFKCDKCDKSYELEKLLRSHQKIHSLFRLKCDFNGCEYKTPHMWELNTHIKNKHLNVDRFVCDEQRCDKSYKYEGDLKAHKRQFHLNIKAHTCEWPGCHSRFSRLESLKNHVLRHKNERQFKCEADKCGKAFNTRKALNTHRTLHTGKMYKFPCEWPGCTRMLASRCHTKAHINSFHLKIKAFECDECHKSFTLKETLTVHKNNTHSRDSPKKDKKEFKCDQCLRVFNAIKYLENHKKSAHSSEPLYACDWDNCEERFKTSHALTLHKAFHMNGGQYKCCAINCGKSFTNRETLLSHELIHNKKFVCNWPGCAKRFAKNFLLTHHIKRHQNIREFKCEVEGCGQSFVTKTNLDHHLDKHSNPLPFKCLIDHCDRGFTRKSSLQNHMEKVHHANVTVKP